MTHRERDARTVIATQLSHKIRERDLKDFFSSVGDVRAVKLVKDEIHKTQGKLSAIELEMFIIDFRFGIYRIQARPVRTIGNGSHRTACPWTCHCYPSLSS